MPSRKRIPPLCPKPGLWPVADRRLWQRSLEKGDILDGSGGAADWAPRTRVRVAEGYGRWISWLSDKGKLYPRSSPADRVEPKRLKAYVDALRAVNAIGTVLSRIEELGLALSAMAPERVWTWVRTVQTRLRRAAVAARTRRRDLPSSEELYTLGLTLMAEAERMRAISPAMRAGQFRDGLMISLLAARPLRRHNFVGIEVGRHLVKLGDGYWIRFAAAETKTRTPIEAPFPVALVPALERYLSTHRPVLAKCRGYYYNVRGARPSALWLSQHGTAMSEVGTSDRFRNLTRNRLGRPVTMHRFRDSAATSIAIEDPEHVRITMAILGHTTLRTSERHYNHANSLQALRRYQGRVLELRRSLSSRPRSDGPRPKTRGVISSRSHTQ
jgi:integrase/recombinase XerD